MLSGFGNTTLSGTNTYRGGTIVNAGTLIATNAAALPSGSSLKIGTGAGSVFAVAGEMAAPPSSAVVAPVPEPGTLALLIAGALVAGVGGWRRGRSTDYRVLGTEY